jgi:hypothetical protein
MATLKTHTAMYNTLSEKVFSFHTYIDNKPANNKDHVIEEKVLSSYSDNELAIYRGDNAGFSLAVLHENEPVGILMTAFEKQKILNYIAECKEKAEDNFKFESEILTTMIAIHYKYSKTVCLEESALLLLTKNEADFLVLDAVYQSMYLKFQDYLNLERSLLFEPEDFIRTLSDDELNVFKFTMISALPDFNFRESFRASLLYAFETDLPDNCFEKFGISDDEIESFWQKHKICAQYFVKAYRAKKSPSVYYFNHNGMGSYLEQSDELSLYRSRYHRNLKENYDYVLKMNQPEDRG